LDFSTISHAHAETVLRGIAYCRFRFDVRLGPVFAISEKRTGRLAARRIKVVKKKQQGGAGWTIEPASRPDKLHKIK